MTGNVDSVPLGHIYPTHGVLDIERTPLLLDRSLHPSDPSHLLGPTVGLGEWCTTLFSPVT